MSAFYNYSEPFSCECRAFGRLQEAGHEELALKCFGYVLLDKEHEQLVMTQFSDLKLDFNGDIDYPGGEDMRSRFLGKDDRPPPIRGVVKEFGLQDEENLGTTGTTIMRKILRDVIKLQKLGIIKLDFATRQIFEGKLGDFSTALTVPHFIMTPELNPHLTPQMISAMELETFKLSISDYLDFDWEIFDWNMEHADQKPRISASAFPGGRGCQIRYNLRSNTARERVFTFVDPRKYDWGTCPIRAGDSGEEATKTRRSARISKGGRHGISQGVNAQTRRRLTARPPMWYYNCDARLAARLRSPYSFSAWMEWDYKEGFIFPRIKEKAWTFGRIEE